MTNISVYNELDRIPKLYSNCLLVKGNMNHIICDLQMQRYIQIPTVFTEAILNQRNSSLHYFKDLLNDLEYKNYISVLNFLHSKGYLDYFDDSDMERFPALSLSWETNSLITNAIIDFDTSFNLPWKELFSSLSSLGCQHIQLRNFTTLSFNKIDEVLGYSEKETFASISLILPFSKEIDVFINQLVNNYKAIREIFIFSSTCDKEISNGNCKIIYVTRKLSKSHCGNISKSYFSINVDAFSESQKFNSCLNRKVGIDELGNVKNCPSMSMNFGNIIENSLFDIIENTQLKDLWSVNKNSIQKCKDCEFRYICSDCRAYVEDPEDILSKPLKCGYNPYTGEWSEWSDNPLKQKAIDFYGMRDMVSETKN